MPTYTSSIAIGPTRCSWPGLRPALPMRARFCGASSWRPSVIGRTSRSSRFRSRDAKPRWLSSTRRAAQTSWSSAHAAREVSAACFSARSVSSALITRRARSSSFETARSSFGRRTESPVVPTLARVRGAPLTRSPDRSPFEDNEHAEAFIRTEAVLGAGRDEDGVAFAKVDALSFHLELAAAFEHDVDLVIGVRLLAVGLRSDEHVDTDLDPGRGMDDLVAAVLDQALLRGLDVERMCLTER